MQAAVQPLAILRLPPFRAAKPSSTRRPSFQRHLQQRSQPAGWGRHRRRPPQPCATAAANATPGPAASPYGILGVAPGATQQEIKASYRRLALKVHPDVSEAPDADARFAALAAAYDTLSDPRSRRLYDLYGVEGMKKYSGALLAGWAAWESGHAAMDRAGVCCEQHARCSVACWLALQVLALAGATHEGHGTSSSPTSGRTSEQEPGRRRQHRRPPPPSTPAGTAAAVAARTATPLPAQMGMVPLGRILHRQATWWSTRSAS